MANRALVRCQHPDSRCIGCSGPVNPRKLRRQRIVFRAPNWHRRKRRNTWPLATRRGGDPAKALRLLDAMVGLVDLIGPDIYGQHEAEARKRLGSRDPDDWPILATALAPGMPDLDRRHGFLRLWRCDLDIQQRRDLSGRLRSCTDSIATSGQSTLPVIHRDKS
jgi:hypothetical protein